MGWIAELVEAGGLLQRDELYAEVAELIVAVFPEVKEVVLGD